MRKPKVVVALLSEEQEFQVMQAADAQKGAARLGLDVEVVFAEGNPIVQIQQLFRFIHARDDRPATVKVPSNTGPGLDLLATWRRDRKPLPAEVLLTPSSFPSEARLREPESFGPAAGVASPVL